MILAAVLHLMLFLMKRDTRVSDLSIRFLFRLYSIPDDWKRRNLTARMTGSYNSSVDSYKFARPHNIPGELLRSACCLEMHCHCSNPHYQPAFDTQLLRKLSRQIRSYTTTRRNCL